MATADEAAVSSSAGEPASYTRGTDGDKLAMNIQKSEVVTKLEAFTGRGSQKTQRSQRLKHTRVAELRTHIASTLIDRICSSIERGVLVLEFPIPD